MRMKSEHSLLKALRSNTNGLLIDPYAIDGFDYQFLLNYIEEDDYVEHCYLLRAESADVTRKDIETARFQSLSHPQLDEVPNSEFSHHIQAIRKVNTTLWYGETSAQLAALKVHNLPDKARKIINGFKTHALFAHYPSSALIEIRENIISLKRQLEHALVSVETYQRKQFFWPWQTRFKEQDYHVIKSALNKELAKQDARLLALPQAQLVRLQAAHFAKDPRYGDIVVDTVQSLVHLRAIKASYPFATRFDLTKETFIAFHTALYRYGNATQIQALENCYWMQTDWEENKEDALQEQSETHLKTLPLQRMPGSHFPVPTSIVPYCLEKPIIPHWWNQGKTLRSQLPDLVAFDVAKLNGLILKLNQNALQEELSPGAMIMQWAYAAPLIKTLQAGVQDFYQTLEAYKPKGILRFFRKDTRACLTALQTQIREHYQQTLGQFALCVTRQLYQALEQQLIATPTIPLSHHEIEKIQSMLEELKALILQQEMDQFNVLQAKIDERLQFDANIQSVLHKVTQSALLEAYEEALLKTRLAQHDNVTFKQLSVDLGIGVRNLPIAESWQNSENVERLRLIMQQYQRLQAYQIVAYKARYRNLHYLNDEAKKEKMHAWLALKSIKSDWLLLAEQGLVHVLGLSEVAFEANCEKLPALENVLKTLLPRQYHAHLQQLGNSRDSYGAYMRHIGYLLEMLFQDKARQARYIDTKKELLRCKQTVRHVLKAHYQYDEAAIEAFEEEAKTQTDTTQAPVHYASLNEMPKHPSDHDRQALMALWRLVKQAKKTFKALGVGGSERVIARFQKQVSSLSFEDKTVQRVFFEGKRCKFFKEENTQASALEQNPIPSNNLQH